MRKYENNKSPSPHSSLSEELTHVLLELVSLPKFWHLVLSLEHIEIDSFKFEKNYINAIQEVLKSKVSA